MTFLIFNTGSLGFLFIDELYKKPYFLLIYVCLKIVVHRRKIRKNYRVTITRILKIDNSYSVISEIVLKGISTVRYSLPEPESYKCDSKVVCSKNTTGAKI